jgi:hypothetical protein
MGLGSIISGGINASRSLPIKDLSALFATLDKAGGYQKDLINKLPESLKPLYEEYKQSLGQAGATLQASTSDIGQRLLEQTKGLYGPDSDVVKSTLAGLKTQDYSTLPGTLRNLTSNLAATGGLQRGGAAKALTAAVMAPAQAYSGQAQTVMSQQLQAQQQNTQNAINKIASMDDQTAQSLFGMSKDEASQILTYGRDDLKTQLTDLVNQSVRDTSARLGLQNEQAENAYQNALTRLAQKNQLTSDITQTGLEGAQSAATGISGAGTGSAGFDKLLAYLGSMGGV